MDLLCGRRIRRTIRHDVLSRPSPSADISASKPTCCVLGSGPQGFDEGHYTASARL